MILKDGQDVFGGRPDGYIGGLATSFDKAGAPAILGIEFLVYKI